MKWIIRWFITFVAIIVAALIVPGITVGSTNAWVAYAVMAAVLALVNAFVRPILTLLSCGCIAVTLGLFLLVINAFTLWFSSWICQQIGIDFEVETIWAALFGSIVVSVVSFLLGLFLPDE